jgi:hypothetical protein
MAGMSPLTLADDGLFGARISVRDNGVVRLGSTAYKVYPPFAWLVRSRFSKERSWGALEVFARLLG